MKMKRLLIICILLFMAWPLGAQADFTLDADAIETAALSVLKLECTNKDGSRSTGSGFVVFNSQMLVTNCHVMDEAKYITASDDNDNVYEIDKVHCVSESMDIAILGFSRPTALKPLELATGSDLKRGQQVVAIGSPKGLKNTVSTGVVSYVFTEDGVPQIQITAPISPGSSGGALFDDSGRVVGITTSQLVEGQNLNFAVQGSVPLALYAAWKGESYTFYNWPRESPMDFSAGEKLAAKVTAPAAAQAQGDWLCPACGQTNSQNFCLNCGTPKPQWQCACGQMNVSKFCGACGKNQENLVSDLNAALALAEQGQYEQAAAQLEKLGKFNCGGVASQIGTNVSAEDQLRACYYNWGLQLEKAREYAAASEKYMASNAYGDAPQRIMEMAYLDAEKYFAEGQYMAAAELFMALGDYKDAMDRTVESTYQLGCQYIELGREDEAVEVFTVLEDYKDSASRIKDAYCHKGARLTDMGAFGEAILAYEAAGDYEPAKAGLKRTHYLRGEALLAIVDYAEAAKAFEMAGDYQDAAEKVKAVSYLEGEHHMARQNWATARKAFLKAADYEDAGERIKASHYIEGEYYLAKENFEQARRSFGQAGDYQDAQSKFLQINLRQAEKAMANKTWSAAIELFEHCLEADPTVKEKLILAYNSQIQTYLDLGSVNRAYEFYQRALNKGVELAEPMAAAPGSRGKLTTTLLTMARDMGFIKKLDKNEDTFDEKYKDGILEMETALGLNVDGSVSLAEMSQLEELIYPGSTGTAVRDTLEKLFDLGYIDKLEDNHSTYPSKLKKSVQKAEKALGLNNDGILTPDEKKVIMDQPITPPSPVSSVKAKVSNGDVTLTWSKAKGAVYYTIYRDGKQISRTESTKYTDKNAVMGSYHLYEVLPHKYTSEGEMRSSELVYVSPVYESVSLKELWGYTTASHIKVSNVRKESQTWDGNDLIMLVYKKIDGTKYRMYLRFENYKTGWDWDNGGIAEQRGLDTITAKGRTDGYKRYSLSSTSYVVLNVSNVEWTY